MNVITQIFQLLARLLKWWVIVEPWEQAVRVRLGKHMKIMEPGLHFRIPFVDAVYVQNVRMRAMFTASQTVSTTDDYLVTVSGVLRYRIVDVMKLQMTLHDAQGTVLNLINAIIAECIATRKKSDITPNVINECVNKIMNLEQYGIGDAVFALQDFAAPRRVIRLIQDVMGQNCYVSNSLTTNMTSRGLEAPGMPSNVR